MEWTFRNTIGKDRLDEIVEMYESLDFEVKVEVYNAGNAKTENSNEIKSCDYVDTCMRADEYYIIYTRKKSVK